MHFVTDNSPLAFSGIVAALIFGALILSMLRFNGARRRIYDEQMKDAREAEEREEHFIHENDVEGDQY